ncbi:MAG: glycosyltransferase family 4 protein [Gemmatimonadales bacterium]|nr:glycosyltransferase family 4 protein [Gemmatimonadales bacterium]
MRILYLTQWFEPEPMIKGVTFVRALAALGHEVEVVTGFPNYPTGKLYAGYRISWHRREVFDGVVVHRLPLYPSHDGSSLGRILNYLSFLVSAAIFCGFWARRFDVIYAYPPITVGLAAAIGGWITGKPFVLDIQDLWPDSVVKSGMPGTARMRAILNVLCNFVYRRSARILSQSRGIKERLVERGVPAAKIEVIYNWADEQAAAPSGRCDLRRFGFENRFNIVYGGNLGRVQGLDTLIRAASRARDRAPQLQLLLIGDGMEGDNLRSLVREIGATNVRIEPGVPRAEIGDVFAAADVLVLHLWDDPLFEITIPQKTQFYMAMGKPVLVGVSGEAGDFITDAGAGVAVPPQNVEAMTDAMVMMACTPTDQLAEMGLRAREAYSRHFSFDRAVVATGALLQDAIEDPRGERR